MSDETPNTPPPSPPHRDASVTLRTSSGEAGDAELFDRANRSALDALKIAYTLLSWIMIGLVVLFVLSGFQSVGESERAVRLRFGAIVDQDLGSGFQFAYPAPIGELVKVPVGQDDLRIDDAFYPDLTDRQRGQRVEEFASGFRGRYEPERDGSLITADLNLAHLTARVYFRRVDPTLWITNIDRRDERELIRVTAERAIVRAVSEVAIDDIVKLTPGSEGSVAARAADIARDLLSRIDSGIEITRIDINNPGPPISLYNDFAAVTSATAKANEARERAEQDARTQLNRVAGAAAAPLVDLIDRYERATDLGDAGAGEVLLAAIDAVLRGEAVEVDPTLGAVGDLPEDAAPVRVAEGAASGEVTVTIGDAETYRRTARDAAQTDLAVFRAKLPQYLNNPRVLIVDEWTEAMSRFLTKETVQAFYVPVGSDFVDLELNRDPQIQRAQERARNREELQRANREREEMIRQEDLRLRTGEAGVE
ncbi:MAG: SPFH domain-containing protein [Phycisphaerales bacterium]